MPTLIQTRPPQARRLTAADRGDCCGAQAFVLATKPDRAELLFCAHHYNRPKTDALLIANGWSITDYSRLVNAKPTG